MFHQDGDTVTLTMHCEEYLALMMVLGGALAAGPDRAWKIMCLRLFNSLNEGNPTHIPLKVPTE